MDEEIKRLKQKLKKIRGNDPISKARRAALILAIYELENEQGGA
jgi:hypothetical protein